MQNNYFVDQLFLEYLNLQINVFQNAQICRRTLDFFVPSHVTYKSVQNKSDFDLTEIVAGMLSTLSYMFSAMPNIQKAKTFTKIQ